MDIIRIRVGKIENGADFSSIGEGLLSVPYDAKAVLLIDEGIYEEKVFCEKRHISLVGAGMGKTVIRGSDGGGHIHSDGRKTGTFRSYTAFFSGEYVYAAKLTIENCAGTGKEAGQAIAAYVESDMCYFENVDFRSRQDTLFCAPLPSHENLKNGFLGPGMFRQRRQSMQYYKNCHIRGDVDFIFGGANALFENCEIFSLNRNEEINGYITAPSTNDGETGFIFSKCSFLSDCPPRSVYLGRPWRKNARCVVINSYLAGHIHERGWCSWDTAAETKAPVFSEFGNTGPGSSTVKRVPWAVPVSADDAVLLLNKINEIKNLIDASHNEERCKLL